MCSTTHQSLADAHHFDSAPKIHRVLTLAVFAGNLSDPGVHTERAKGVCHERGDDLETLHGSVAGLGIGHRPGERNSSFMDHRGATAGQTLNGVETVSLSGSNRLRIPGRSPIRPTKGNDRSGHVDTEHPAHFAMSHRTQD